MKADPRDCYVVFFKKFQKLEADYMKSFTDELDAFKVRIRGELMSLFLFSAFLIVLICILLVKMFFITFVINIVGPCA